MSAPFPTRIRSILVANRSEIAIRVMRAASELGIRTVGIYSAEDRFALHRTKADESYLVGAGRKPVAAYLDIADIIRVAREADVDAIHPGYGFLSENPDFAEACVQAGIVFIGPRPQVMRILGNKVSARELAQSVGVPVMPATGPLPRDPGACVALAAQIGYPLMLKASWGGGGRGMRVIHSEAELASLVEIGRREALSAFGNDEVYLEKLVRRARHVEVQVLGDQHGELVHLYERDCSVQRRNQKVVEQAPAPYLSAADRTALCEAALEIARAAGYTHAGTVEFLADAETGAFYFIEVNPRIQVEHTVTEAITGVDIVKAQIRISQGARIEDSDPYLPRQADIRVNGHAVQCRITTEDPENGFAPDYGRVTAYRSAAGFGIRLDAGTAYTGAVITPFYDSLLVKVTAWGHDRTEAVSRMDRALREFRIRGVATNLQFLENVIGHPLFASGECTTRFVDETAELLRFAPRRDRATRLLQFIGEVTVNGNPEMKGRAVADRPIPDPVKPACDLAGPIPEGPRDRLRKLGARRFAEWMRNEPRLLVTDTTMRDAHQSLHATRMRTRDMLEIAPFYARMVPQLFSVECWGGATFDVALRFLKEDPWERLDRLRARMPNLLLQMLLRASNAVGYTNYPDRVVRHFIHQASAAGIDLFRVFDSMNDVNSMRAAMDAVGETGALCEAAICYTADLFDSNRPKYGLKYYLEMARQLERSGAHILAIKDMAGICKPAAARTLVAALREETGLPVHFHTHDTTGASAASVLAAVDAGVDAVDGALDAMSGLTSQPNLSAIVAAVSGTDRDSGLDQAHLLSLSRYWEGTRRYYAAFEPDMRGGTTSVYRHEMPGGQYTNLREQARAIGIGHRWPQIEQAYADVNRLFGDIVKVTPTSKVVGDMALFMVSHNFSAQDVADPKKEMNFPESVVSLFSGDLGMPPDGFPPDLSRKILKGQAARSTRSSDDGEVDLDRARSEATAAVGYAVDERDLSSWLMYPTVFTDYARHRAAYGDVSTIATPVFFNGLREGEETTVEIERGKTLVIRLEGRSETDGEGYSQLFFELNGQPRVIRLRAAGASELQHPQADEHNRAHVGAPMAGTIVAICVESGQAIAKGEPLVTLEAMKMESTLCAERDGVITNVHVKPGQAVSPKDLLVEIEAKA